MFEDVDDDARAAQSAVTLERLERAIRIVADMMVKHNRPGLIEHIKRLEAERDRLRKEADPMAYAKQILSKFA